ncbi:hypothetical protein [Cellulomonas fimi]|uniref:hypothetical protein n=1 Tax=Cellulomonas fimi TaxID=1708 RepID=UPI0023583119|nr:hypothetical protein [Cellulomonas fimi]
MRNTRAALTGAGALALLALLAGCSTPDDSPVPTLAEAPWICPGVPQTGVELALGGPAEVETTNSWEPGLGHATFQCFAERGDDARLMVTYGGPGSGPSPQDVRTGRGAVPISADADGEGWAEHAEGSSVATWQCGDNILRVGLVGPVDGRDGLTDVSNLLVSMLPWACEGEEVPALPD